VVIPPGTENGVTTRVPGQGEPGRHGGAPGDLNVLVHVRPHPIFRREGEVVVCDVPISLGQAVLGGVIEVPTLEGHVEMRIPAATQSGALFRLREKGMVFPGGRRGDAHVRIIVETPTQLNERQRQLLAELSNSLTEAQEPVRSAFLKQLRGSSDNR
jgi:molecular chaperone DnaJ